MIYVIKTKNAEPAFIKIGYAGNSLEKRIKSIQTSCPFQLELIYAKNGSLKDEKSIHLELEEHRGQGEWFRWNEVTQKYFKLSANPKPVNPSSPGTFLTPRQKQINHLFRKGHSYQLYVHSLDSFLGRHNYSMKDLLEIPEKKRRFHLFESTTDEVSKMTGSVVDTIDANSEEKKLFISALEIVDWREVSYLN